MEEYFDSSYDKKGYLEQGFRIFRLRDSAMQEIPFHYHDFHKIIFFLAGEASYIIEGKTYPLAPRDILFVSAGEIHRPVTFPDKPYERIVIYLSPQFLGQYSRGEYDLAQCFLTARQKSSVMHAPPGRSHDLLYHMDKLEAASREQGFANELYTETLFIEFIILLNRSIIDNELQHPANIACDPRIQKLLDYINTHLTEELTIDLLAQKAFTSKFYLMRKFKADTGCSIHQYINSKRLLAAKSLLAATRLPITELCYQCGFTDYSAFSREFKKNFHMTPKEYRDRH
ncbi:MAG: AraC family transcriptional regulator [Anaerovibrio sp.]|nr:AraC family transcriptional regulator [Anaerovibrio sp.]